MRNQPAPIKQNNGMALVVSIIFLLILGLIVTMVASRVSNQTQQVNNFGDYQDAFLGIISAYDTTRVSRDTIGLDVDWDFVSDGTPITNPELLDKLMTKFADDNDPQLASLPNVQYISSTNTEIAQDRITTFIVARYVEPHGEVSLTRRFVYTQLDLERISPWDTAIFAGVQQSGNVINGNVQIHGSVHILGDSSALGDISVVLPEVISMTGGSGIFNNYDFMLDGTDPSYPPNNIRAEVPELELDSSGNETLKAKLRVRVGQVSINGNTTIGQDDQDAGSKGNMDGVYVTDGWTGNKATGGEPDDGVVFTDDYGDYDLEGLIDFPSFAEVVASGDPYFSESALSYYMEDQVPLMDAGEITIKSTGNGNKDGISFYYNATPGVSNVAVVGVEPGVGLMPDYNTVKAYVAVGQFLIWFDATAANITKNKLLINGRIAIDGELIFTGDNAINYEGKGTILVYDDDDSYDGSIDTDGTINPCSNCDGTVTIDTDLITDDGNPATRAFPNTNLIGIMVEYDLFIGTSSKTALMGGFYAQSGVSCGFQTHIIGTIVGDYFDMGNQVPRIYQVPSLAGAWEPEQRMIGDTPTYIGNTRVWHEVGATL